VRARPFSQNDPRQGGHNFHGRSFRHEIRGRARVHRVAKGLRRAFKECEHISRRVARLGTEVCGPAKERAELLVALDFEGSGVAVVRGISPRTNFGWAPRAFVADALPAARAKPILPPRATECWAAPANPRLGLSDYPAGSLRGTAWENRSLLLVARPTSEAATTLSFSLKIPSSDWWLVPACCGRRVSRAVVGAPSR